MARLIGGLFGKISGNIGDFTIRNINGKAIVASRPKHIKVSMEPHCVEIREKFAVTTAFSKVVAGLSALNEIWNLNKVLNATVRNTIFKFNFNLSAAQAPSINNIITPYGFHSPVNDVSITAEKLTGSLASFNSIITIKPDDTGLSINAVVCSSGPKAEGDSFYDIISLSKEVAGFDFSKQYDFEIDLSPEQSVLVAKYNQKIIYFAVAIKSSENKVTRFSRSFSKIAE